MFCTQYAKSLTQKTFNSTNAPMIIQLVVNDYVALLHRLCEVLVALEGMFVSLLTINHFSVCALLFKGKDPSFAQSICISYGAFKEKDKN